MRVKLAFLISTLIISSTLFAENIPFRWLAKDSLQVNDGLTEQLYLWQNGQLCLFEIKSIYDDKVFTPDQLIPDIQYSHSPVRTDVNIFKESSTSRTSAYSQIDLYAEYDNFAFIRSLRVYDDCEGVEWRLKVKGNSNILFPEIEVSGDDLIENPNLLSDNVPHYFYLPFSSPHFTTKIVSFKEATDHQSNLVNERTELPYRKQQYYRGNIFIANNNHTFNTHLIVKLSPLQETQSAYSGFDFSTSFAGAKVHSPGFETVGDENGDEWKESYPLYVLLNAKNEHAALNTYKKFELSKHRYLPEKDNTFIMNTWGDRNRDSRVNEQFILNELDAAYRLGITHFQIDDGWQQGISKNSAQKDNLLWDVWATEDWNVNTTRFPNGLTPVSEKADSLDIKLGLWFNPSKNNNYYLWERDKTVLLNLHNTHNISWIKIDGLSIGNKEQEKNVYNMLQGSIDSSNGELQFNMDATAGKRGGYFFFNHFGNTYLENRYTDWGNYYPHMTLRNIWQLAEYVPVQRFQIEWLNKWRNNDKYPQNDPLKPYNVPFEYLFATTMIGQSLAWMEATALPEEAFDVIPLIQKWKENRSLMQKGIITPIGQMPDGYSFPGFISSYDNKTFILLYRENTYEENGIYYIPVENLSNKNFTKLAGDGSIKALEGNNIEVSYTAPFQFIWGYFE